MPENMKKIKIGMGQLLVEGGEPERNLERAGKLIQKAAQEQCDLILLPETMDLAWTHPSAKNEAQPIPGRHSDQLVTYALENKIYICGGLTEQADSRVYNAAILINPSGDIILKYRKINVLTCAQEFYAIGNSLSVVETPLGVIGVNICSDNYYDSLEIGHVLARMGAQMILSPSSWTSDYVFTEVEDPYKDKWFKSYHTLAGLYDIVVISSTSVGYIVGGPYEGKKMVGISLAVGKDGLIASGSYNEIASELITIDVELNPRKEQGTAIGEMLKTKGYVPKG